jgi:hypothetical protein
MSKSDNIMSPRGSIRSRFTRDAKMSIPAAEVAIPYFNEANRVPGSASMLHFVV